MARTTASVRVAAPSLLRMERTWNFAVDSEMSSAKATSRLASPSASRAMTSCYIPCNDTHFLQLLLSMSRTNRMPSNSAQISAKHVVITAPC